jgi:hypothetical protein
VRVGISAGDVRRREQPVVTAAELIGAAVPQALAKLGRTDQIGEEEDRPGVEVSRWRRRA